MVLNVFPKKVPPLTEEQKRISDDFMKYWHTVLPNKYSALDRFGHLHAIKHAPQSFIRTLELGAGNGEHLKYENLTPEQKDNYVCIEMRKDMADEISRSHPGIRVIIGDCQEKQPFGDGHFDRIIAIHVLEHLPDLPKCIREMHRLINKNNGLLLAVIPCEGGFFYNLARRVSSQRIFEKRYKQPYQWFISREHLNRPSEILTVLQEHFKIKKTFFPFPIPSINLNLVIGLTLEPKKNS